MLSVDWRAVCGLTRGSLGGLSRTGIYRTHFSRSTPCKQLFLFLFYIFSWVIVLVVPLLGYRINTSGMKGVAS